MWRLLALICLFSASAARAEAALVGTWEVCDGHIGDGAPKLDGCRPLQGVIDPQGRELWLRAPVRAKTLQEKHPSALYIFGATSSEAWFNGVRLGSNGTPGPSAAAERPGLYEAEFPIPPPLWRAQGQALIVRLSAFHAGMRFDTPIGGIGIGRFPPPSRLPQIAVTFAAAGALMAAFFGFAAVYAMRRTRSSLTLAAMAGVAALQALVENYRTLANYPYPFHVWRVNAIWGLSAVFALLLVAFASSRFLPRLRSGVLGVAALAMAATYLLPGFDVKSGAALIVGVGLAGLAAAVGVHDRLPGARMMFGYLAIFAGIALATPYALLDVSFFLLAASLTLPLLVVEVVRLGRDDRDREVALTHAASRPDRLTVATAKGVVLIPLKDIVAIVGADDYVELRLVDGRRLLHAARLDRLEASLPGNFVRAHRSAIANLGHVERLEREGAAWRLHTSEGPPLPVSRSRFAALRQALDETAAPLRASA